MSNEITLRPPKDADEFSQLAKIATEEKHRLIHPSHFIIKDEEPIGCLSIFTAPIIVAYFSKGSEARDTVKAIQQGEIYLRALGHKHYFVLCDGGSPLYPVMEKMGFKKVYETNLMTKGL